MKVSRKIAIGVGALLGLLLIVMIAVPVLFRDRIAERAKAEVNEAVSARVEWEGVGLSLLRSFPHLGFRLDALTVTGIEEFEGDTLASIPRLRLVLDLPSVWRHVRRGEPVVVRSIDLDRPALHLRVLEDGSANWDIVRERPEEPDPEARDVAVSLRRFAIRDGTLTLDNREAGLSASLTGLDQSLRGDFTRDSFVLRTRARADEVSVRFGGLPYLNRARLDLMADIEADMVERRFTFRENELRLNDLAVAFSGSVEAAGDDVALDLTFGTPHTDFRHILSLVRAVYARDFESLQTSGTMAVSGRIEGRYSEDAFPSFALSAAVEDGTFRYADLPLPARDIAFDLAIENPGGDLDSTVVSLRHFHMVIGDDPIDAGLVLRTPVSDPDIDFRVVGRVDLANLLRTLKLEGVEELSGVVSADAALRTRMSFIDARQYDRIVARGGAEARNVTLRTEDLPHPVFLEEAELRLSPQHAELTSFRGRVGESDLRLTGYLDNLLGYALRNEELRGRATLESRRFDLNDWRSEVEELEVIPVPGNIDFSLQTSIGGLTYGTLVMTDARGALVVDDRRVTLEDFSVRTLGGEVRLAGFYETTDVNRPTFDIDLRMRSLDIPAAFGELVTVRTLAPVAGYARGSFSADLRLSGALGPDMIPLFGTLAGRGALETSRLALEDFPGLNRVADVVRIPQLRNPTLDPVRASFDIRDGRLHASPFEVHVGDFRMTVTGSNGIDQTLQYSIRLEAPRALLGSEAERAVAGLLARAGRAGIELEAADVIELAIQLTGTVTDPSISTDVGRLLTSAREGVERPLREEAARRLEELEERADEAAAAARAQADRLVREAEERAAQVRQEAQRVAETVRREGHAAADSLLQRATTPVTRAAARPAAERLRREADERADRIIREADRRADEIVADARRRTAQLQED